MSRLERLVPSASTLARTVGTGLPTFPLGLTEAMVIAPPEPVRPPPLLVADPVRLVALLTVRSTTFLGFGTCVPPYSCGVCSFDYYSAPSSAPNSRVSGDHRQVRVMGRSVQSGCISALFTEVRGKSGILGS